MIYYYFLVIVILTQASGLDARIYTWTDSNGIKHFSNGSIPKSAGAVHTLPEDNNLSRFLAIQGKKSVVTVVKVHDGDSIKVSGTHLSFEVRLVGIDAPESGGRDRPGQPFSRSAKTFLANLISGREVILIPHGTDRYNRQLAEIIIHGKNVNLELVKAGLAEVYRGRLPKGFDSAAFNRAQAAARWRHKGIWSLGNAYISPKQWRKMHPLEK